MILKQTDLKASHINILTATQAHEPFPNPQLNKTSVVGINLAAILKGINVIYSRIGDDDMEICRVTMDEAVS